MRVQYIRSETFHIEVLNTINKQLSELINESFEIHFEEVDSIAAIGSGKPQIVISKLKN